MKKVLLSVGILLSTLSLVMGQRYINFSGSTAAGFTAIYPLPGTITACGYTGGGYIDEDPSPSANGKKFSATFGASGLNLKSLPSVPATLGYYGLFVGIVPTDLTCGGSTVTSVNLNAGNANLYIVAKNNGTITPFALQATIGNDVQGATNDGTIANNLTISNSYTVQSIDYTGKFLCQYSCPVNNATPSILIDATNINQMNFGVLNGTNAAPAYAGYSPVGVDLDILAVGVGYQSLVISGTLGTFTTSGSVQSVTVSGGILSSNLTITAPSGFTLSTDGSTYGATASIVPTSGLINSATVYVKFTGASTSTANVSFSAASILTKKLAVASAIVTGYDAYSISQALVVSPNPTSEGYISVTSDLNISNITVVNAQGAPVNTSVNGNRVNTASLTPGVYTLLIDTEKGRTAKKIIVE